MQHRRNAIAVYALHPGKVVYPLRAVDMCMFSIAFTVS